MGNGECNDWSNDKECNYDGGDCCGPNPNTMYCSACQCLSEGGVVVGCTYPGECMIGLLNF